MTMDIVDARWKYLERAMRYESSTKVSIINGLENCKS